MSVRCKNVTLLSKSLRPLPEKFHGLTDKDLRYRQRYVDLIMNPEVRRNFEIRSQFIRYLRAFLDERGYMEVETPVLNTISGGATARPFITHHNTLDLDMYMRIATELHLKRLIVGGLERVYEIGRIFRNEGMDTKHNPEFTTIELYEAYADFHDMMDLFEAFLSSAAQKILGTYEVTWQGEQISLAPGWPPADHGPGGPAVPGGGLHGHQGRRGGGGRRQERGGGHGAWSAPGATPSMSATTRRWRRRWCSPPSSPCTRWMSPPLAKRSPKDPRLTERFECFVCHSEMGNAFSELNDPIDQKQRFQKQVELRDKGDSEAGMMDDDFITALEYGLPPHGRPGHRHRPVRHAPDRGRLHPGRDSLPHHEAPGQREERKQRQFRGPLRPSLWRKRWIFPR